MHGRRTMGQANFNVTFVMLTPNNEQQKKEITIMESTASSSLPLEHGIA
jgi:hypothetical protein